MEKIKIGGEGREVEKKKEEKPAESGREFKEETPAESGREFLEGKKRKSQEESRKWGLPLRESLLSLFTGLLSTGVGLELSRVAFLHPEIIAKNLGESVHEISDVLLPARLVALSVTMLGLPLICLGLQGIKERIQERRLEREKKSDKDKY
jgi:hypothetical protein